MDGTPMPERPFFMPKARRRWLIALVAVGSGLLGFATGTELRAQQPWAFMQPAPLSPAKARVQLAPSRHLRELAQIDSLIESEAWEEAVDGILRLIDPSPRKLVAIADDHFVPLHQACHLRIARWPEPALTIYRGRVDPMAAARLERAIASRSAVDLQSVVDEFFCSDAGDDALLALGDLALERGDSAAARGYWQPISPALTAPDGRPWGVALAGVDLDNAEVWEHVAGQFKSPTTATTRLAFPDSEIPIADLLARLAVVSIREGNFARAKVENELLRRLFPETVGRIAGREAILWQAVARTLSSAQQWPARVRSPEWPTLGGSSRRERVVHAVGDLAQIVWTYKLEPSPAQLPAMPQAVLRNGRLLMQPAVTPPLAEAVVAGGAVVVQDGNQLRAFHLQAGRPLFGETGEVYRESAATLRAGRSGVSGRNLLLRQFQAGGVRIEFRGEVQGPVLLRGGRLGGNWPTSLGQRSGQSQHLTLDGSLVYAILGPREKSDRQRPPLPPSATPSRRLLVLDLAAEGKLKLEIAPDEGCRFSGPAVIDGDWLYLPLREKETSARLLIACYARSTGRQRWRSAICSFTGSTGRETDLLTLGDGLLFANTNAGVIAAVRKQDGQFAWVRTYPRGASTYPNDLSTVLPRPPGPCLFAGGALVCAPPDAPALFALDPASGKVLWTNEAAFDVTHLLGVAGETVVATGRRLWRIDVVSGQSQSVWPESLGAGIEGNGRGCLAGDEVFWPTKEAIYTFHVKTGQPTRVPLFTPKLTGDRVNLIPLGEQLLLATRNQLTLLGPGTPASATNPGVPASAGGKVPPQATPPLKSQPK